MATLCQLSVLWILGLALLFPAVVFDSSGFSRRSENVSGNEPQTKKRYLLVSLIVNLGALGIFKYFDFFIDSFQDLASLVGITLDYAHLNIILPVGISFYTFQTLSYSIDIYRGNLKPTNNFLDFALFVAFFLNWWQDRSRKQGICFPRLVAKTVQPNGTFRKGSY